MARGISEQDVFEAADKLLARGERPTIERVRSELGRGSPNTVNRLLDGWWIALSSRLVAKETPKLPPQFLSACERLYEKVLADCRARAQEDFTARLTELESRQQQLAALEQALSFRESTLSVPVEMLRGDLAEKSARVTDLTTEKALLGQELAQVNHRCETLVDQLATAEERLVAQSKAASVELSRVKSQWEAQENRWLRQIDALREDLKLLRGERAEERRAAARKVGALDAVVRKLRKDLVAAKKSCNTEMVRRVSKRKVTSRASDAVGGVRRD